MARDGYDQRRYILGRPEWIASRPRSAEEALTQLTSATPDIALVDFNMPGTDGLALAEKVSALRPRMPVAIISANFQQEIVDRARAIGAVFMPKPITEDALQDFLSRAEEQIKGV